MVSGLTEIEAVGAAGGGGGGGGGGAAFFLQAPSIMNAPRARTVAMYLVCLCSVVLFTIDPPTSPKSNFEFRRSGLIKFQLRISHIGQFDLKAPVRIEIPSTTSNSNSVACCVL